MCGEYLTCTVAEKCSKKESLLYNIVIGNIEKLVYYIQPKRLRITS